MGLSLLLSSIFINLGTILFIDLGSMGGKTCIARTT
jgi:hypothetical protein